MLPSPFKKKPKPKATNIGARVVQQLVGIGGEAIREAAKVPGEIVKEVGKTVVGSAINPEQHSKNVTNYLYEGKSLTPAKRAKLEKQEKSNTNKAIEEQRRILRQETGQPGIHEQAQKLGSSAKPLTQQAPAVAVRQTQAGTDARKQVLKSFIARRKQFEQSPAQKELNVWEEKQREEKQKKQEMIAQRQQMSAPVMPSSGVSKQPGLRKKIKRQQKSKESKVAYKGAG